MFQVMMMVAMVGQIDFPPLPGFQAAPIVVPQVAQLPPDAPVAATRVPDASDATAWAVQDILLRQPEDRLYCRYLWVPPWQDVAAHQVNSFVVNSAISQSSVIALPDGVAGGWLIRWDLRRLAPKDSDLKRLITTWDFLAFSEPYFHIEVPHKKAVACRSYQHIDGKTYTARRFLPALHCAEGYAILERETLSFAPLLRADDFLRRVASTIDGGLYYHFVGFVQGGKRMTEAEIFKTVGLDVALSRTVEGDDRAAVFQSAITGKPRMVEQVQGAIGKARITYDLFDEDVDAGRHPIYELLDFVGRARGKEIIFERSNGLLGYVLTDGSGRLVDVAPPNLASDHRTPEPVTGQLYPMLGCIRCHGPTGGVQSVRNDVAQLLEGGRNGDLDLFDDLSSRQKRFATVDRLAGLYAAGDKFQGDLDLARMRFADATWTATRGMGVHDSEKVASKTAEVLADQYAAYWYPPTGTTANISADQAAMELGYKVAPGDGAAFLRQALKPGRVDVVIDGVPVEFADPALGALRRNLTIRRQDWTRVFPYAAHQILESRKGTK